MDALALAGDEGRGKLRKASVSRKQAINRRCPNGETPTGDASRPLTESIGQWSQTQGSETSQYLKEKKSNEMAQVAASERAQGLNRQASLAGLRDLHLSDDS